MVRIYTPCFFVKLRYLMKGLILSFRVERKIKNNIYIYEVTSHWDASSKKVKKKSVYIGKKDNSSGEINKVNKILVKSSDDFGNKYFFRNILRHSKLDEILKNNFEDKFDIIIEILLYQLTESKPSYLMEYSFTEDVLASEFSSQNISRLFSEIGKSESNINKFLKDWIDINKIQNSLFYDITSISSYSKYIEIVEWGYNRDCEKLPQINFGILYGSTSKLPLLYKIYPGSISDVSTLKNIHEEMKIYGFKKFTFCLDRGFYSASNLLNIYSEDFEIIIPMPFSTNLSIELCNKEINDLENMINFNGNTMFSKCFEIQIEEKKFHANIYLNEAKKLKELDKFSFEISEIENKFSKNNFKNEEDISEFKEKICSKYKKYFNISNKDGKYKIEKNTVEMRKLINKMGKVILLTKNPPVSKEYAITSYLYRDEVEKVFDIMKNELHENRLRVSSSDSVNGKLFLNFLSLICMSFITKTMKENKLFSKLTINELISELRKLKIITMYNGVKILCELTKKQKNIFNN